MTAVVTFGVNGTSVTVALEYECTAKSSREYERVCADLNCERKVALFVYLVPSLQMQAFLVHAFRRTARQIYVGIMQEFCDEPRRAELVDVLRGRIGRLDDLFAFGLALTTD